MKKIELFQCEFCGQQYTVEDTCKTCEGYHMTPQDIVESSYNNGMFINYPHTITVLMSDGKKVEYYKR